MKAKIYYSFLLTIFVFGTSYSQTKKASADTGFFNYAYWNGVADKYHYTSAERAELLYNQHELFLKEQAHIHDHIDEKDIVWTTEPLTLPGGGKKYGQGTTNALSCNNVDFEAGNFTGWTRSTGWNPLTNVIGCCPYPNGDQTIMSGTGTDPFSGYPVVWPGGGSFSLRLGSTAVGGIADRVSQTFFVTPANANFTYRYAAVLNDGGHPLAQQPKFTSEIIDTLGNPINCTFYQASAGSGVTGYSLSALGAPGNNSPVIYKNWTNVSIDLTPNIGQNVTLRFTVYDCGPSGHFAYAYLDGLCTSFQTSVSDTACPNVPLSMCAPAGFSTTTWNGPGGVVNDPNQCISVTVPGTYTCTTVLIPGCPGPTFTHTLNLFPAPSLIVNPVSAGPCTTQYTFNNTSTIPSPYSIIKYIWDLGDGYTISTTTPTTPIHNYALPGTYQVKFKTLSNRGCLDSVITPITIFPSPNIAFSPPSGCLNTVTQFTNLTTISAGSIASYNWNFYGSAPNTTVTNPSLTYTANGTYSINLTATSNQGCSATKTQTLSIYPAPILSFTAASLCDRIGTSFTPSTSASVVSGSLVSFLWNFGDGATSTLPSPVHSYSGTGVFNVVFSAVTDHNCSATVNNTFMISPSPTVAFSTTSLNACSPNFTFTNNSGISVGPITYTWSLGGTNTTTAISPSYTFPSIGNYTVMLVGQSNMGCQDTAIQKISIYPYPVINFSVPASCENAIITVSTTAVSGSVTSYLWDFGDPSSGALNTSTLQNPTHFYSATNNYTVTLNIVSNLNCPSTSVTPLTVFPNPTAGFNFTTASNCSLPQVFVNTSSVSSIGASSLTNYIWNFQGIGTSSLANPGTVSFPSNGTYSVSLIAITNHNCSDTISTNVVIHPFPQVNFTVNPNCIGLPTTPGSTAMISPIPSTLASLTSYTWDYGDNTFTNSALSAAHMYTAAGIYTIMYGATSNMGCSSSLTHTVQIFPAASINFTTTSSLCFGVPTQFTSTNTVASGTIYAMNWDFGDGTLGSNPTTIHSYTTPGSYPVTYSATTNDECMTVLTRTVNIYPLPAISNYTVNGGCLNVVSQFAQTTTISLGSITSYSWNFGDGGSSVAQNPNYTYTLSGTYFPTVTATSNQGCTSSAVNSVVINPLPNIVFSPPGACQGTAVQFTNTSSILLGTINSYTWNFGNGNSSNLISPVNSYPNFGFYTVTLGATSNLGCSKTTSSSINIYPYPQLTVTPIHNSCINDTALLNTNISIPAGAVQSYSIDYGDGGTNSYTNIPSTYIDKHKYTAYNTYTIHLKAISNNGCLKDTTNTLVVYPKPFVNFAATNFCHNGLTAFTNSSTIPNNYTINDHLWNFNDGSASPTSTLSSPSHLFVGPNTYTTYPVSLTELSYPEGLLSPVVCSLTATKSITIFPRPAANFYTDTVCIGKATPFHNLTPTVGISGWSWSYYNNGQTSNLAQNPSYTYTNPSVYNYTAQLIALNSYGCRDTAYNTVTLYHNPVTSFTTNNNCLGQPSVFFNNTTYVDGSFSGYVWTIGNNTITTNTDATYTFSNAGTYSVSLTALSSVGCSAKYTSTVTVYPLPILSFSSSATCLNQSTQFTNQSYANNIASFGWNFGDPISGTSNTSSVQSPSHLYTMPGSYITTLSALSDKNCSASIVNTVIVHNVPKANYTNTVACVNTPLVFTNLSTSTDGSITSNAWDFNGDNIIDQNTLTPSYSYTVPGNYMIRLTVTTQYGCSNDTARTLFVNPKPVGAISADYQTGCPSLCVNFKNLSTISTGSFSTSWDFGDNSPANTVLNPSHCYNSGTYDINLTMVSDIGCTTKYNHPAFITVFPLPVGGFKVDPEQVDEDEPIITVSNQASPDANYIKYYVSDGTSFGTPNFTHYIKNLKNTKPMVVQIVKNQYGCVDTISQVLNIKPAYVIYFPNVFTPNGDGTNDDFRPKGVGIAKFALQIYDRWGHMVFHSNDMTDTWDGKTKTGDDAIKEDTYTWKAQVTDVLNQNHFLVGHVTVLR